MRSKLVLCAALAGTCLFGGSFFGWLPQAHAADPKSKKKTANDSDDKVIDKQMQWEDSVMGPDDKRAELDKIARAQAINKAAAEKAAREKEKADAAAKEAAAKEAAAPKGNKRGGEVALPTLPDEDTKASKGKSTEISPKLQTEAAATPPPPVKHGDDKFIDKLLKDDGGKGGKKKASASDDKALDDLLAVEKPKPAAKGKGRKDDVDALLQSADKQAPMPETHVKHETPEWAKPEIESTPQPVPVAIRPQPKRDDGIIHVVQGAAAPAGTMVPASRRTVTPPPSPSRASAVATRTSSRRQAAPASGNWDDPFAVSGSAPKKTVAARDTGSSGADDLDGVVAQPRRRPAPPAARSHGSDQWNDPFKDSSKAASGGGSRRAAPAAKPANKWKDPFTESAPARPSRTTVASRETHAPATKVSTKAAAKVSKVSTKASTTASTKSASPSSKWEVAAHHEASAPHDRSGRWGVLKKH